MLSLILLGFIWVAVGGAQVWEAYLACWLAGNGDPPPDWGLYSSLLYRAFRNSWLVVPAALVHGLAWPITWGLFTAKL